MKYKKGLMFLCLIICLFTVASVCASDVNGTIGTDEHLNKDAMESENQNVNEIPDNELTLSDEPATSGNDYQIIENQDIVANCSETIVYQVKLVDNDNNPLKDRQVTFDFNNNDHYEKTDNDGYASYVIGKLNPGSYGISAAYGDINVQNSITVKNNNLTSDERLEFFVYSENHTIYLKFNKEYGGYFKFHLSNNTNDFGDYVRKINSDEIQISSSDTFCDGIYSFTLTYFPTGNEYSGYFCIGEDTRPPLFINFENMIYGPESEGPYLYINQFDDDEGNDNVTGTVKTPSGNAVSGERVYITFNYNTYIITTDAKGVFLIKSQFSNLTSGRYVLSAIFKGNENYSAVKAVSLLVVESEVDENNKIPTQIEFLQKSTGPELEGEFIRISDKNNIIYGILKTYSNEALADKKISITFNDKTYTVKTNSTGVFNFTCPITSPENHALIASFSGDGDYNPIAATIPIVVEESSQTPNLMDDFEIDALKEVFNSEEIEVIRIGFKNGLRGTFVIFVDGNEVYSKTIMASNIYEDKLSLCLEDLEIYDNGDYNVTINYVDGAGEIFVLRCFNLSVNWLRIADEVEGISSLVEINLPDNIAGNIVLYINNEKYENISIEEEPYGIRSIPLPENLDYGQYNVTVVYEGNQPSVTLNKIVNVTYPLYIVQPSASGFYDPISSDYVDLYAYVPSDITGKLTVYLNGKTYQVNQKNEFTDYVFRIFNEDLVLGTSKGIFSLKGDDKYPDKNVTFNFYIWPEFNRHHIELVEISNDNAEIKLYNDASGTFNIYLHDQTDETYKFLTSSPIVKGYGSIPLSELPLGHDWIVIEIKTDDGYYFSHYPYILRVIENNRNINVNLESGDIEVGNDAVIRININDESAEDASIFLDGVYLKSVKFMYSNSIIEKISGLSVGRHAIKIEIDEKYVNTFYVNVKEKGTSTVPQTAQKQAVKTILTLKTVKVKKLAKKLVLQATLKQGNKALSGKKITFKFNGKKYSAKTNKKGIAKVTVKKSVLKKLKVGKKVNYQASYGKITVKKSAKVKK